MKIRFKFLVFLVIILNLTTNVVCLAMEGPNEKKESIQAVDRLQKIKDKRELTVLATNIEPYSYRNPKTGSFSGLDAEIIREVAKRLGIEKVNVKYISLSIALQEFVNDPNIDLIAQGLIITDERKKVVDFTNPVYTQNEVILTRKDSNINSKEDLKDKTIGILGGTVHKSIAEDWKSKGIFKDYITFYDNNSLMAALENRTIDALITESVIAENILLSNPKTDFKLLSPNQYKPELSSNAAYPVKKEDTTLLKAINEKLEDMKKDGTLYEILAKYGLTGHYIE